MKAITREDLERMNETQKEDFVLINVLPREDFKKEHIRTSINIPQDSDDFVETVEKVAGGKDREVVVYCANQECPASPEATKKLDEAGFRHVLDYEAGMEDWAEHHRSH